ncbi:MAG: porin [Arenicellales bacterium]
MNLFRTIFLFICLLTTSGGVLAKDELPTRKEMWKIIQQQQKQIDELMSKQISSDAIIEETVNMVEATADAVDQNQTASVSKTHIGGYGELHYNNLEDKSSGLEKNEIDFHRFVMFFGHEFNNTTRFFSELELEHGIAGEGQKGEIELEQAYVEHDLSARLSGKAGLFLIPVGILNETHEPNTFYGVERNPVEKYIIPTTWWGGGLGLSGGIGNGWSWDTAFTSGLNTSVDSKHHPRSGRQKVSKAVANNGAITGRLKWAGLPGLELATTLQYQDDITQGNDPLAGAATLAETHAIIERGALGLRALYAQWQLDGEGPASIGADKQYGWYIEPAWRINSSFGLFARYAQWDNSAGSQNNSRYAQSSFGANYWLNEHVVFKFDLQDQDVPDGAKELDGFNLGFGYQF